MFRNNAKYLGFKDFWFFIIGIILLGFLIPQIFFGIRIDILGKNFLIEWLEASLFSVCYWLTTRAIMISFRKKYPSFELTKKRLVYVILATILAISILATLFGSIIVSFFQIFQLQAHPHPSSIQAFGASYTATFFILTIYESIWYYSQLKKSIQEQERIKVAHVQSQLEGLRNQVNPHFLFNSLNTLNHIVEYEDKSVAKNFIKQLSKVYRYILESRVETTISLEEELDFVNAYVAIQKERFLDNLIVKLEIPQQYYYKRIIPLSLQLLIENAIKHNIISTKKPLWIIIKIDKENNAIVVSNNLQRKSKVLHSTKVGLENIKERYRLSEGKVLQVKETDELFEVSLPLLK